MKSLRQICAVAALTLALSLPAFAGDIQLPGVKNPPPPSSSNSTIVCEVDCPEVVLPPVEADADEVITTDAFTEITLSMLQGVFSLF